MTVEIPNPDVIAARCQELATLVMRHTEANNNNIYSTAIEQLKFTRSDAVHHHRTQVLVVLVSTGASLNSTTQQHSGHPTKS